MWRHFNNGIHTYLYSIMDKKSFTSDKWLKDFELITSNAAHFIRQVFKDRVMISIPMSRQAPTGGVGRGPNCDEGVTGLNQRWISDRRVLNI